MGFGNERDIDVFGKHEVRKSVFTSQKSIFIPGDNFGLIELSSAARFVH